MTTAGYNYDCWDDSEYWLNEPDEDEPLDELEEWLGGRCGFSPETGSCSEAGSEECEFECPLRDELYGTLRERGEQEQEYWEDDEYYEV